MNKFGFLKRHLVKLREINQKLNKNYRKLLIAKEKAEESSLLKTEFINNLSHEIRTPMNGILGFSELIGSTELTKEKLKNYIEIIQSNGKQLMRIIDDILEISLLGTKQVKIINSQVCLNDLLIELFSVFNLKAKEKKISLYLENGLTDEDSNMLIDDSKILKILSNLLENALKFTNSGFIKFGYKLISDNLEFFVADTGIGIEKNNQKKIFERFSQENKEISKKVGGIGLGLSIVKENTELLGGKIKVKSKKGEGTTFLVTIPYKPITVDNEKANCKAKNTILIAEDDKINFLYLETVINNINSDIKIIHAKNGKEAMDICLENKIDLLFMDLRMPLIDGYQASEKIYKLFPKIPSIALTANTTKEVRKNAVNSGCLDLLSKPVKKETINKILKEYLYLNKNKAKPKVLCS